MRLGDWLPAIGGAVCLGLGAGLMAVYGFFSEHLAAEFAVGMATINIGPLALILVPGLVGPYIGRLADAVPIRRLLLVGATVSMLAPVEDGVSAAAARSPSRSSGSTPHRHLPACRVSRPRCE